ncbi:GntR family transcriptional regulator/MocR family aminotransferase [Variovorax boronicumulans]|uniref:MocR-like pyridoxine biosynthesis transcription factor PdxR n=1 Tax=Variovorax boronicumulans TaxID=436515 RepID=UPI002787B103|nr:PLP-dependent aminotransferase family protein [Variovorax boronicumulans]MDP9995718.1 GntR family transcriptional regulator/MocR family aminotransferase [Variovorax boronicumulans]MDQ0006817.1 GntR family transcriptional regulator/MocR family aminotransferase [Variovorax boronicumulans]MDQ0036764.1 GntR family transcriptional regulator/MocR family aminotransferase [Variovorax boronicumulans]
MKSICADLVLQRLSPASGATLNRQLYECLREAILDGSLPPSSALPASRDLARESAMSRNTVLHAYAQLQAEGYVHSRVGSGTFVAEVAPDNFLSAGRPLAEPAAPRAPVRLSKRAQALLANASATPVQWGAFMPGVPDVTQFPHRTFSRILTRLWRAPAPELLTYSHGGGHPALRIAITEHLRVARSVRCEPDQILVTEGVHQAIDMSLRMLVDPRDTVWVEEPGYWGFHKVLQMDAARVLPLHVETADDGPGAGWPRGRTPPRLIFVTPSHQYPLGAVMSLARRRELLGHARAVGGWIVEDDYDSEFRFAGRPIPAMQGLEADSPVIYIGTFSKTLFPGLRVGYMVLPRALAGAFRTAHADLYREGHAITQAALAELITEGHYAAHIRRMRVVYARRRAMLAALITTHLGPDYLDPQSSNAGLHLVLRLPDGTDDVAIAAAAQAQGVSTRPLSQYYRRSGTRRGLLLGYACVPEQEIERAFRTLLVCLRTPP